MSVERLSPDQVAIAGGDDADVADFIRSDFRIRSGLCPNGCGLMNENDCGQKCPKCNFCCNTKAEKGAGQ